MNCSVEKLKSSFVNDNLPYFNMIKMSFHTEGVRATLQFKGGKYKVLAGAFYTSSDVQMPSSGTFPDSSVGDYRLLVNTNVTLLVEKSALMYVKATRAARIDNLCPKLSDFNYATALNGFQIENPAFEGVIEDFIEAQCSARESGSLWISFGSSYSVFDNVTLNGNKAPSPMEWTITENGATCVSGGNTVATYTKATGEWSYPSE